MFIPPTFTYISTTKTLYLNSKITPHRVTYVHYTHACANWQGNGDDPTTDVFGMDEQLAVLAQLQNTVCDYLSIELGMTAEFK